MARTIVNLARCSFVDVIVDPRTDRRINWLIRPLFCHLRRVTWLNELLREIVIARGKQAAASGVVVVGEGRLHIGGNDIDGLLPLNGFIPDHHHFAGSIGCVIVAITRIGGTPQLPTISGILVEGLAVELSIVRSDIFLIDMPGIVVAGIRIDG